MNLSSNAPASITASKENIPSSKTEAAPVQQPKPRTVLGVLSENELRGRSVSQGSQRSKPSSISDSSQVSFFGCPSTSSFDVFVEEACEVVLAASGEEVASGSSYQNTSGREDEDLKLLLDISWNSFPDDLLQFDDSLMPEEVLRVSEYAEDIHQHLRESEMRLRPKPAYLELQSEITNGMRIILVDWMVEVVQEYKLCSETLHLAVNYLDRFLSRASVKRAQLQLVGTAALLIAAKYEEIFPPELDEFVYITDSTYTKKQLMHTEHVFLKVLEFELTAPTRNQFLHLFQAIHSACVTTKNLSLYIAELSLLEIDPFLKYTPSIVAAGAYCLANYTVNTSFWPDSLEAFTGYTMNDIVSCLNDLHKLYISADIYPQRTIREKYSNSKYCGVSLIPPPAVLTVQ